MKKIFRFLAWGVLGLLAVVAVYALLFVNFSPQFGSAPTEAQRQAYQKTGHYQEGEFINLLETKMDMDMLETTKEWLNGGENRTPSRNIEVEKVTASEISSTPDSITQLMWFGHSAFLLQIDGKKILLDPMLGENPSPHPLLSAKRYSKELPIKVEDLPYIDAVIFSHDHYDHLDYQSVVALKDKVGKFFVPLGLDNHLVSWGVKAENIEALDWWQETALDGIKLALAPARHFSGRGLTDRNATLWGSWIIEGAQEKIYFSGDGGYGTHFKEIGERYGPFDLSLMECGQYNKRWKLIHMMPEETVQAAIDLQSKRFMPIHWGAFTLSLHSWTDPVERASVYAQEKNIPITTPKIGEVFQVGDAIYPTLAWWEEYTQPK